MNNSNINAPSALKVDLNQINDSSYITSSSTPMSAEPSAVRESAVEEKMEKMTSKSTKAGKLGKSTGRWTRDDHKKFLEGKRFQNLRIQDSSCTARTGRKSKGT